MAFSIVASSIFLLILSFIPKAREARWLVSVCGGRAGGKEFFLPLGLGADPDYFSRITVTSSSQHQPSIQII